MSFDWLRGPASDQPLALAGLALACVVAFVAAVLLIGTHSSHRERATTVTTPEAPSAVVGTRPPPPALTAAQLARVRVVAVNFLDSYLPVLYGRRPARTITDADPRVRAELSAATRSPRAPRNRRPRITQLTTHVQSSTTIVAIAVVADSVSRPYQIVFQLTKSDGRWQITQLANY